jgi:hypothetical protein
MIVILFRDSASNEYSTCCERGSVNFLGPAKFLTLIEMRRKKFLRSVL